MAGPRVLQMIGQDFSIFSLLSRENSRGIPSVAIIFQSGLAVTFILSSTFESVLVFSSFVLGINTLFSVFGIFVLRRKKLGIEGAYKTFGYPWVPLVYLSVTLWTLSYVLFSRPQEALVGFGLLAVGGIIYQWSMKKQQDSGRL
jgi:APA family basic amino acid/polyamine antiporter